MDSRARCSRGGSLLLSGRRPVPRLHLIATDEVLARPGFLDLAGRLVERGGAEAAIHLRSRLATSAALLEIARGVQQLCARSGGLLIVNDRIDVAIAAGAAGVQLGSRALPVNVVRDSWPGQLIGASVHGVEAARAAAVAGADFLLAGTLWASGSHPGRPGSGTGWLPRISDLGPPVIGIGGVREGRVAELRDMGVHGVAVVRAVWDADTPLAALDAILAEVNGR